MKALFSPKQSIVAAKYEKEILIDIKSMHIYKVEMIFQYIILRHTSYLFFLCNEEIKISFL